MAFEIVLVSPGGVRGGSLGASRSESYAEKFAADLGWSFVDENGFEWSLDVVEVPESDWGLFLEDL